MKTTRPCTDAVPPGGGACWWCDGHLYRNKKSGKWSYATIHEQGYERAVHVSQCGGPNAAQRPTHLELAAHVVAEPTTAPEEKTP